MWELTALTESRFVAARCLTLLHNQKGGPVELSTTKPPWTPGQEHSRRAPWFLLCSYLCKFLTTAHHATSERGCRIKTSSQHLPGELWFIICRMQRAVCSWSPSAGTTCRTWVLMVHLRPILPLPLPAKAEGPTLHLHELCSSAEDTQMFVT